MEVVLEGTNGISLTSVLSVKVGDVKKQAPVSRVGQGFRFSTSRAEPLPLKVELLVPVAPAQLISVDPVTERFDVSFGPSMTVSLSVREVDDLKKPSVDVEKVARSRGLPLDKLDVAKGAASYLEGHDLVRTFQDIFHGLIVMKPADPWSFVEEHLSRAKAVRLQQKREPDNNLGNDAVERLRERADVIPRDTPVDVGGASGVERSKSTVQQRAKVDVLLLKLTQTQANLKMVMPFLPDELRGLLNDAGFAEECRRQFQDLDVSKSGALRPQDILPLLVQLTTAHAAKVGEDQCRRFVSLFDANSDGVISLEEFGELVQFVMVTAFMESEDGRQVMEVATIEEGHFQDFICMIEEDRERLWDIIPFLPDWLQEHVTSNQFAQDAHAEFAGFDSDNNGNLDAAEMLPVVVALSKAHPLTIDAQKCKAFLDVFDTGRTGMISRDEFLHFAQFMTIMSFLASGSSDAEQAKVQGDLTRQTRLIAETLAALEEQPDLLPSMLAHLPKSLVDEVFSEAFAAGCLEGFRLVDAKQTGLLDPGELYQVMASLAQPHGFEVTKQELEGLSVQFSRSSCGKLSAEHFVNLARYALVMSFLRFSLDHQDMMFAEVMLGKDRISQLLTALREHSGSIEKMLPFLPEEMLVELNSAEFEAHCLETFTALDVSRTGFLDHNEVMPIVLQMADAHHLSITEEHAQAFVNVFDSRNDGVIRQDEFINFLRFLLVMAYLDTPQGQVAEEMADSFAVEDLLVMLERDHSGIHKVIPLLPPEVSGHLVSEAFAQRCQDFFRELDKDCSGVLTPEELFPVVVELSVARPGAVDLESCKRFAQVFNPRGDFVLHLDEFLDFARFLCIMSFLHSQADPKTAGEGLAVLHDSNRIEELLDMMERDKQHMDQLVPQLPDWFRKEMFGVEFERSCLERFQALDKNGNGQLDPRELYPVILDMSSAHHMALDEHQCERFANIFAKEGKMVITAPDFVEFVRFLMVMAFLTENGQQGSQHGSGEGGAGLVAENQALRAQVASLEARVRQVEAAQSGFVSDEHGTAQAGYPN